MRVDVTSDCKQTRCCSGPSPPASSRRPASPRSSRWTRGRGRRCWTSNTYDNDDNDDDDNDVIIIININIGNSNKMRRKRKQQEHNKTIKQEAVVKKGAGLPRGPRAGLAGGRGGRAARQERALLRPYTTYYDMIECNMLTYTIIYYTMI